ncbi:MAG: hypothetical protein AAF790_11880, partial [Planctomycetota bacterium]
MPVCFYNPPPAGAARVLAVLACCLLAGCNAGKQMQSDLYARELRLQEDEIYRLEACLEDAHAVIRELRQGKGQTGPAVLTPPRRLTGPGSKGAAAADASQGDAATGEEAAAGGERSLLDNFDWSPDRPPPSDAAQPSNAPAPPPTLPEIEAEPAAPSVELPEIDLGEPTEAPGFDPRVPPAGAAPPASLSPSSSPSASPLPLPSPTSAPPMPAPELSIPGAAEPITPPPGEALPLEPIPAPDPQPTLLPGDLSGPPAGGIAPPYGGEPAAEEAASDASFTPVASLAIAVAPGPPEPGGEATLSVRVRPLGPGGDAALFQGDAALMLRDPSRPAVEASLVRWDFTPQEVWSAWREIERDPLLDFAVVVPGDVPADRRLELWVRLIDAAGHKTIAKRDVTLGDLRSAPPAPVSVAKSQPAVPEPLPPGGGDARRGKEQTAAAGPTA